MALMQAKSKLIDSLVKLIVKENFYFKIDNDPTELELDFPTVVDGARGMAFIESAVESSQSDQKWYPMKDFT